MLLGGWICAGRLDEPRASTLPGRLAVVDVARRVACCVTVTREGELRAHYNVCRHRGSQIVPVGAGDEPPQPCARGALRCPYHSWTYDLDGRLLQGAAHRRRRRLRPGEFALHPVGVDAWGGFLLAAPVPGRRDAAARGARLR